jgi:hypothetical protein
MHYVTAAPPREKFLGLAVIARIATATLTDCRETNSVILVLLSIDIVSVCHADGPLLRGCLKPCSYYYPLSLWPALGGQARHGIIEQAVCRENAEPDEEQSCEGR